MARRWQQVTSAEGSPDRLASWPTPRPLRAGEARLDPWCWRPGIRTVGRPTCCMVGERASSQHAPGIARRTGRDQHPAAGAPLVRLAQHHPTPLGAGGAGARQGVHGRCGPSWLWKVYARPWCRFRRRWPCWRLGASAIRCSVGWPSAKRSWEWSWPARGFGESRRGSGRSFARPNLQGRAERGGPEPGIGGDH